MHQFLQLNQSTIDQCLEHLEKQKRQTSVTFTSQLALDNGLEENSKLKKISAGKELSQHWKKGHGVQRRDTKN